MLSVRGIYESNSIRLLDEVPINKTSNVIITFLEDFNSSEELSIRSFSSNMEGFDFWENEKEDLYQDFIK